MSVSVIIPVYNSESYLGRCLESVLGQSFRDVEIICVDDGSTDDSVAKIRAWMNDDRRIKLIRHEKNKGVGETRNTGIKAAEGKWIYFMDSDDWIDRDYIEVMHKEAESSGLDVIVNANYYCEYASTGKRVKGKVPVFENHEVSLCLPSHVVQNMFLPVVWLRLYRRDFLLNNAILFPRGLQFSEDAFFTSLAAAYLSNEYVFKGPYYHYQKREGSLSNIPNSGYLSIIAFRTLYHELQKRRLSHEGLRLFYSGPILLDSAEKFCQVKEFLMEIEQEVNNHRELYPQFDLYLLNLLASCPNYEEFLKNYCPNIMLNFVKSLHMKK